MERRRIERQSKSIQREGNFRSRAIEYSEKETLDAEQEHMETLSHDMAAPSVQSILALPEPVLLNLMRMDSVMRRRIMPLITYTGAHECTTPTPTPRHVQYPRPPSPLCHLHTHTRTHAQTHTHGHEAHKDKYKRKSAYSLKNTVKKSPLPTYTHISHRNTPGHAKDLSP